MEVAHGVADGVHRVAHGQLVRAAQAGRDEALGLNFQYRQVQLLVVANQFGVIIGRAGEQAHVQGHAALDDVEVGDDVPRLGEHHPRAHAGRAVALVGGDAHHRGEHLVIDLVAGQDLGVLVVYEDGHVGVGLSPGQVGGVPVGVDLHMAGGAGGKGAPLGIRQGVGQVDHAQVSAEHQGRCGHQAQGHHQQRLTQAAGATV